jgi:uncharacterized membrane protein
MTIFLFIKLIHIISAIIAVGFNCSYPFWFIAARKSNANLLFTLQGIKKIDDRVANPAYVVSLVTGLLLVYYGNYSFLESRWIFYAAILFSVMGTLAFGFYSPVLSKLIKTLKATGSNTEEYRRLERKQKWLGAVLLMMAMSVVLLMIIKPA